MSKYLKLITDVVTPPFNLNSNSGPLSMQDIPLRCGNPINWSVSKPLLSGCFTTLTGVKHRLHARVIWGAWKNLDSPGCTQSKSVSVGSRGWLQASVCVKAPRAITECSQVREPLQWRNGRRVAICKAEPGIGRDIGKFDVSAGDVP